jgi:hypothetical protein
MMGADRGEAEQGIQVEAREGPAVDPHSEIALGERGLGHNRDARGRER